MTKSVSYFTPRMSRVKMWDEVVFFGLQMFITDYLMIHFHEHFFSRPRNLIVSEYHVIINPDIILIENSIKKMVEYLEKNQIPYLIIPMLPMFSAAASQRTETGGTDNEADLSDDKGQGA